MKTHSNKACAPPKTPERPFRADWQVEPGASRATNFAPHSNAPSNEYSFFDPISAIAIPDTGQGDEYVVAGYRSEKRSDYGRPEMFSFVGGHGYSTEQLPHHHLVGMEGEAKGQPLRFPGIGKVGTDLVFAGGMFGGELCKPKMVENDKIFAFCTNTRRVHHYKDTLQTARQAAMVGSDPDGKYLIVAGGLHHVLDPDRKEKKAELLDSIEIFDHESGRRLTKEKIDELFGCADAKDSILTMPRVRIGGHIVWVKNDQIDRIFFIGGSSGPEHHQQMKTVGYDEPDPVIDVFDVKAKCWLTEKKVELLTGRNFPGVDVRRHADGREDIVIVGGTAHHDPAILKNGQPQITTTEILDPSTLEIGWGQRLHEQAPMREGEVSSQVVLRTGGTVALAIRDLLDDRHDSNQHQQAPACCRGAVQAVAFGFNSTQIADLPCANQEPHTHESEH